MLVYNGDRGWGITLLHRARARKSRVLYPLLFFWVQAFFVLQYEAAICGIHVGERTIKKLACAKAGWYMLLCHGSFLGFVKAMSSQGKNVPVLSFFDAADAMLSLELPKSQRAVIFWKQAIYCVQSKFLFHLWQKNVEKDSVKAAECEMDHLKYKGSFCDLFDECGLQKWNESAFCREIDKTRVDS